MRQPIPILVAKEEPSSLVIAKKILPRKTFRSRTRAALLSSGSQRECHSLAAAYATQNELIAVRNSSVAGQRQRKQSYSSISKQYQKIRSSSVVEQVQEYTGGLSGFKAAKCRGRNFNRASKNQSALAQSIHTPIIRPYNDFDVEDKLKEVCKSGKIRRH